MRSLLSAFARSGRAAIAVLCALALLVPLQIAMVRSHGHQPDAVPAAPIPSVEPLATPPSAAPAPRPAAREQDGPPAEPAPRARDLFEGLGAWVDVYDFEALSPAAAVATMAVHDVRTLYLQTGRYNTEHAVAPEAGPWLEAAHSAGIEVVGWYLPSYKEWKRDVKRTAAIASYRYEGHRFDGLGIDIEFKDAVRTVSTWNARVVRHATAVRTELGDRYPIAAITPTPLGMAVAPRRWAGFPWKRLARISDAVLLMSYWSFREDCPSVERHCAYGYTVGNVRRTRELTGDPRLPIHVVGGVGDSITLTELSDFVRGARAAKAAGASLYDFQTTAATWWRVLAKLA